jgi:serine/threonine protein kinase
MTPERQDTAESSQIFGRYRIRGLLGEAGLGRLYLAEQTGIEGFTKIVTLKRILPQLADGPAFRTLFLNEARVAARLEHPNVVATYEFGEEDGAYFTAQEYLPGEDLAAILIRCETPKPMPVEIAAFLAQQCAHALEYAHELSDRKARGGLVHRDVSPAKIFVTYHGTVKLLDFGVVKRPGGAAHLHGRAHQYAYCAPEQLGGEHVDHRADIFSLGIALWDEVKDRLDSLGTKLSGGQQQRLTIARALSHQPDILCLDEFSIAIDPVTTMRIEDVLKELRKEITIILVTNLVQQARRLADRTMFLWNGDVVEMGTNEVVFSDNPRSRKTYEYINGIFG